MPANETRPSLQLIYGAPDTLAELAPWLADLDLSAKALCGIAAIVGAVETEAARGEIDVAGIKSCLSALWVGRTTTAMPMPTPPSPKRRAVARRRSNPRVEHPAPGPEPTVPSAVADDDSTPVGDSAIMDGLIESLHTRCPNVGDAVKVKDLEFPAPKWESKLTNHLTTDRSMRRLWSLEKRRAEGQRGQGSWCVVRKAIA